MNAHWRKARGFKARALIPLFFFLRATSTFAAADPLLAAAQLLHDHGISSCEWIASKGYLLLLADLSRRLAVPATGTSPLENFIEGNFALNAPAIVSVFRGISLPPGREYDRNAGLFKPIPNDDRAPPGFIAGEIYVTSRPWLARNYALNHRAHGHPENITAWIVHYLVPAFLLKQAVSLADNKPLPDIFTLEAAELSIRYGIDDLAPLVHREGFLDLSQPANWRETAEDEYMREYILSNGNLQLKDRAPLN